MPFTSIDAVQSYIDSIPKFQTSGKSAANFNLDTFQKFCEAMGSPHNAFPSVHVGGTNGKGSTCQILASAYQRAGYKVGLYTSPHILQFSERFKINGVDIPDTKLLAFFNEFESLLKSFRLSYFELSTAIAFWYFANENVDLAIIEVGLGGRLDATNIIVPEAAVITNVSFDHTDILGESLREIALEKSGIIKSGVPVVLGNVSDEAKAVIEEVAAKKGSRVFLSGSLNPRFTDGKYYLQTPEGEIGISSGLTTSVQSFNIAAAWQVCSILNAGLPISDKQFAEGVEEVRTTYPSLGRFEKLTSNREWYFDGAHNMEAIQAMMSTLRTKRPISESILVLSMMNDKVYKELLMEFSEFKKIFYHEMDSKRAAPLTTIKQLLPAAVAFPAAEEQQKQLFEEFETELVIFAGSFYFYVTVRDWLASFTENR